MYRELDAPRTVEMLAPRVVEKVPELMLVVRAEEMAERVGLEDGVESVLF